MTTVQTATQEKFSSTCNSVKEILNNCNKKTFLETGIEIGKNLGEGLIEFGGKFNKKITNDAEELMQKVSEYQEIIENEELSFGEKVNGIEELMVENSPIYKIANWTKNLFSKPENQE